MSFINNVVTEIWRESGIAFQESYEKARKLDTQQLFEQLSSVELTTFGSDMINTTALVTSGCRYHISKNNKLGGCSMCDLHSDYQDIEAAMKALREKDKSLYAQVIRNSFIKKRGIIENRYLKEYILCHNFLDEQEINDDVLNSLFGKAGVFKKRPLYYELETNVTSIKTKSLDRLEKFVGKTGISFRLGIECQNEWIRNHWLNKNTTNKQIINSIELCHSRGYKITGNIIIGIPGLTEEQSLEEFKATVRWLSDISIDMYSVSILNRKENTLQGFLYNNLSDNMQLNEIGIGQGRHTGIPWLFTIVEAILWGLEEMPDFRQKFAYGQLVDTHIPGKEYNTAYNDSYSCECYQRLNTALGSLVLQNNWDEVFKISEWIKQDKCYDTYRKLLEKQKSAKDIPNTISIVGGEIAKTMWPDAWEQQVAKLNQELTGFN